MNPPKAEEIEDIKSLHALEFPWRDYAVVAGGLFALLLFGFLVYRYFKSRTNIVTVPQVSRVPVLHWGVEVNDALRKLESAKPADFEALRKCYFELSALLRLILEKYFQTNMTELTSREISERLASLSQAPVLTGQLHPENPITAVAAVETVNLALPVKDYFARVDLLLFAKQDIGSESYATDCLWVRSLFSKALNLEKEREKTGSQAAGLEKDSKAAQ